MSVSRYYSALIWMVLFLAIAIAQPVCGEELPKAKTIDELAERYDVSTCMECHEDQHQEWTQSAHSRSMVGSGHGRTRATIKTAVTRGFMTWPYSGVKKPEDVKIEHLMLCARCHLPQLAEATDDVAQEIIRAVWARDNEELNKLSINCLVCHQRNATLHKWQFGAPKRTDIYGTMEDEHEDEDHPNLKRNPIINASILCGQCHGLGPGFGLEQPTQCATGYGSYLWAYIPEGGTQTCQDCHMKNKEKGHSMPSYRDPDMQEAAVDMRVDVHCHYWRKNKAEDVVPLATVQVELTNRTGHGIPDG